VSPELVVDEKANPGAHNAETPDDANSPIAGPSSRRRSSAAAERAPGIGNETDVLDRAERSRDRASRELDREDARPPDKKLTTARSPSAERGEASGFTLPVVEEEDKSTGGRSNDDREQEQDRREP
jgi:hypothetical protein